jgi:selenide,water dikinase
VLVLTKPIGSGTLTTAAKKDMIGEADLTEAIAVMSLLNRTARDAMVRVGVSGATDITGFGLIGHAFEMADASNVTLVIDAAAVPLMKQARDLAARGVLTRAHTTTLEHVGDRLDAGGVDETLVKLLADAQTSGGLLISIPADRADALLAACGVAQTGVAPPAIIGRVEARTGELRIRIR